MITLDQVHLLEHKVESAVAKIVELQRKNLLMSEKCTELEKVNASLLQKIASFEADQGRIEQGILHALDRLNSMENSILKSGSTTVPENLITQHQAVSEIFNTQSEHTAEINEHVLPDCSSDNEITLKTVLDSQIDEIHEDKSDISQDKENQDESDFDLDFQIDVDDELPSKPQNGQFDIF